MTDAPLFDPLISTMTEDLIRHLSTQGIKRYEFIGIRSGGVWVAQAIQQALGSSQALGELDISFYRDDFSQTGLNPRVAPSKLPFDPNNKHIVLIDDVLETGRTVRAAMNELFDYGRPASITLAVLVDVGRRQLPINPTIVGAEIQLNPTEHIKLSNPERPTLKIQRLDQNLR